MMTTMAALLGAVSHCAGVRPPAAKRGSRWGLVVVGGLLFSQLVTLYLTAGVLHLHGGFAGTLGAPPQEDGPSSDAGGNARIGYRFRGGARQFILTL